MIHTHLSRRIWNWDSQNVSSEYSGDFKNMERWSCFTLPLDHGKDHSASSQKTYIHNSYSHSTNIFWAIIIQHSWTYIPVRKRGTIKNEANT